MKFTGKHKNLSQIGPASVSLSDLTRSLSPTPEQKAAMGSPTRCISPPLIHIPRSEGNASGLTPEPSDRELVQLVMAANHSRYAPRMSKSPVGLRGKMRSLAASPGSLGGGNQSQTSSPDTSPTFKRPSNLRPEAGKDPGLW